MIYFKIYEYVIISNLIMVFSLRQEIQNIYCPVILLCLSAGFHLIPQ